MQYQFANTTRLSSRRVCLVPATNPVQLPTRTNDQPGMTGNDRKWQEKRKNSPCKSEM